MRHFLADDDLSAAEQLAILDLADALKAEPFRLQPLRRAADGRGAVRQADRRAPGSRSRPAIAELGGHPMIMDAAAVPARPRRVDRRHRPGARPACGRHRLAHLRARSGSQEMADHAGVPVINGLTDQYHPCQVLADLQTIREHKQPAGRSDAGLCRRRRQQHGALLPARRRAGGNARPDRRSAGFQPDPEIVDRAQQLASSSGGSVLVHEEAKEAVADADVVATDTWISMGQEDSTP